jgi:hypothetical protein
VLASHTLMLLSLEPLQKRLLGQLTWAGSQACTGQSMWRGAVSTAREGLQWMYSSVGSQHAGWMP